MNTQVSTPSSYPARQGQLRNVGTKLLQIVLVVLFVGVNLFIVFWGQLAIGFMLCGGSSQSGLCGGILHLLVIGLPTLFFLGRGAWLIFHHRYWLGSMNMVIPVIIWIIFLFIVLS